MDKESTMTERRSYDSSIAKIETLLDSNNQMTAEMHKAIFGNGGAGLLTKSALNRQSIKRIWWWVGGLSMTILGIAGCIVKKAIGL